MMRALSFCAVTLGLGAAPLTTWADDKERSASEALFDQGIEDMEGGRYELACPALAESHRLDPTPGSLFTLASCESKRGRIATAVVRFKEYLVVFGAMPIAKQRQQSGRETIARAEIAKLSAQIPEVVVELPAGAPPGTTIHCDGAPVPWARSGLPIALDPGEHRISAGAPGRRFVTRRVELKLGAREWVTLAFQPQGQRRKQVDVDEGVGVRGVMTYATFGLGVAGLVTGAITGGMVLAERSVVREECEDTACTAEGFQAVKRGRALGLVSTVGFGVGLAGLGAAAALVLTRPGGQGTASGQRMVVRVGGSGAAEVLLQGVW